MNDYSKEFSLEEKQHIYGSPFIIESGAVFTEKNSLVVFALIKFQSISRKNIKALQITVKQYNVFEEHIGDDINFTYITNVSVGELFGQDKPIYLNSETKKISFVVDRVIFEDKSLWQNNNSSYSVLPKPKLINEVFIDENLSNEIINVVGKSIKLNKNEYKYIPMEYDDLWYCICGSINKNDTHHCYKCENEYYDIDEDLINQLTRKLKEKYIMLEKERQAALEKKLEEEKRLELIKIEDEKKKIEEEKTRKKIEREKEEKIRSFRNKLLNITMVLSLISYLIIKYFFILKLEDVNQIVISLLLELVILVVIPILLLKSKLSKFITKFIVCIYIIISAVSIIINENILFANLSMLLDFSYIIDLNIQYTVVFLLGWTYILIFLKYLTNIKTKFTFILFCFISIFMFYGVSTSSTSIVDKMFNYVSFHLNDYIDYDEINEKISNDLLNEDEINNIVNNLIKKTQIYLNKEDTDLKYNKEFYSLVNSLILIENKEANDWINDVIIDHYLNESNIFYNKELLDESSIIKIYNVLSTYIKNGFDNGIYEIKQNEFFSNKDSLIILEPLIIQLYEDNMIEEYFKVINSLYENNYDTDTAVKIFYYQSMLKIYLLQNKIQMDLSNWINYKDFDGYENEVLELIDLAYKFNIKEENAFENYKNLYEKINRNNELSLMEIDVLDILSITYDIDLEYYSNSSNINYDDYLINQFIQKYQIIDTRNGGEDAFMQRMPGISIRLKEHSYQYSNISYAFNLPYRHMFQDLQAYEEYGNLVISYRYHSMTKDFESVYSGSAGNIIFEVLEIDLNEAIIKVKIIDDSLPNDIDDPLEGETITFYGYTYEEYSSFIEENF